MVQNSIPKSKPFLRIEKKKIRFTFITFTDGKIHFWAQTVKGLHTSKYHLSLIYLGGEFHCKWFYTELDSEILVMTPLQY